MKYLKYGLITGAMVLGSLALASPMAFAATAQSVNMYVPFLDSGQTSVTATLTPQDSQLQPPQTLQFTFTPSDGGQTMTTTGTYIANTFAEYTVPVPNFGKQENVMISTTYALGSFYYSASAGPLLDTLPFAPLAAALPLGMLGVWYVMRKRHMLLQS